MHGVPLRSWIIARFADSARLASLAPWLYNAILQTPVLRRIVNRLIGFHPDRTMPRLNHKPLHKWFAQRKPLQSKRDTIGRVHLFCDEFTDFNDLDAGIATVELLELLGYEVVLPKHVESGRASLSKGLVRRAKHFAEENVRHSWIPRRISGACGTVTPRCRKKSRAPLPHAR
jgi:Fe-S oxidoreductase